MESGGGRVAARGKGLARCDRSPERERHLAVHHGHVTHLTKADRLALATFGGNVPWNGWVGEAEAIRARAAQAKAAGTTELLFVPSGDDLVREAEAFFRAVAV
jgi:5,10-methylenetetrahydromethanopterin reductase